MAISAIILPPGRRLSGPPRPAASVPPIASAPTQPAAASPEPRPAQSAGLEEMLGAHWAVYAGGLAMALGGVFLVRYSIEAGLIGPRMRIFLGALLAAGLIALGEYFRRKEPKLDLANLPDAHIPSVLTAAGTIVAFGTCFAAYAVYGFMEGATAFVLLGAIGLATMLAAALHGPALAGLGLAGSYVTPLLIASHSPEPWPVVVYLTAVAGEPSCWLGARLAMARLDRSRGRGWLVLRVPGADGIGERGDDLGHPFDGPRAVADGSRGRLHGRRATLGHPRSGRTSRPHRVRRAHGPHDSRHSRRSRDAVRARHVARVSGPDDGSIGLNGVGQRACGGLGHPRGCGGPRRHAAVAVSELAAGQVSDPAHAATATLAAAKRQPLPDVCRGLVAGHRGVRRASPVAWARPSRASPASTRWPRQCRRFWPSCSPTCA